jgi:ActD protein
VLGGGLTGLATGFALQEWVHSIAYPVNVAGKPLNSWPQFIPVMFELTILFAAIAAVIGMIVLNGLPQPYHPAFNVARFERASRDKFFLIVESDDPKFDRQGTAEFLKGLNATEVSEVEP